MSGDAEGPAHHRDALDELRILIRSRYGLIHLRTTDHERARSLLRHLADQLGVPLFVWSRVRGLTRAGEDSGVYDTKALGKALIHVVQGGLPGVYHFHGIAGEVEGDPVVAEQLREATAELESVDGAVVVTGTDLTLPDDLDRRCASVTLPGPGSAEFRTLLKRILRDMSRRRHVEIALSGDETHALVNHLSGLTLMKAEKILTKAVVWEWGLPLLKLDPSNLYHKYICERERNFKRAMQTAERMGRPWCSGSTSSRRRSRRGTRKTEE